jgi:hypothetical protein
MLPTKKCLKCGEYIPRVITIDGKKRNLQKRKFCLICSPFGKHNTKKIHLITNKEKINKRAWKKRKIRVINGVYSIVGTSCWVCNYDKGMHGQPIMDFHHVNKEKKCFGLSATNIVGMGWKKVWEEIQKCVLLCCRCHREYHAGLILYENIYTIQKNKWKEIKHNFGDGFKDYDINIPLSPIYNKVCIICGKEFITKEEKQIHCSNKCSSVSRRKIERPSKEQLEQEIEETNYCAIGRKYGVSDNAIRKWARSYNII